MTISLGLPRRTDRGDQQSELGRAFTPHKDICAERRQTPISPPEGSNRAITSRVRAARGQAPGGTSTLRAGAGGKASNIVPV
jgi:hypothetical protein